MSKIYILIPAYNEETRVGEVVSKALKYGDVVVVDDGSKDHTREIAMLQGAHVIRHDLNQGKGTAIRTGFNYLLNQNQSWEGVILMDADGQHDASEIPKFLDKALDPTVMMVVGNRMDHTSNMPMIRKTTNALMSSLLSKFVGFDVPDTQCGFRYLKRQLIEKIKLKSSRFDVESEMLIEASCHTKCIVSVNITSIYQNEESKIRIIPDTKRFLKLMCRAIMARRSRHENK